MMDNILLDLQTILRNDCGNRTVMGRKCTFWAGDIGLTAKNELPAVIIRPYATAMERQSTTSDQYKFTISILVVTDITNSMAEAGMANRIVKSHQELRKLVEEYDSATRSPKADTILGSLVRFANITNADWAFNIKPKVDYRPAAPEGWWYCAAEITLEFMTEMTKRIS